MKEISASKKEKLLSQIDLMEFKIRVISMDALLNEALTYLGMKVKTYDKLMEMVNQ